MNLFNKKLCDSFYLKSVFKIIAGLNTNDINSILKLTKASELANATYIDIIANTNIVSILKSYTNLPICVSSINPIELYNCSLVGADIVEIGNFDFFYPSNLILSSKDILNLALETRYLIPDKDICVTIPHYLSLFEQITLAKKLEKIGVNIIQTEAYSTKINNCSNYQDKIFNNDHVYSSAQLASASLSSTHVISKSVNIPVLTSSGINSISSSLAFIYGASGIGIGSAILKYKSVYSMYKYIKEIMYMISNKPNHSMNNTSVLSINTDSKQIKKQFYKSFSY
uniref:Uncharacterized protein ycf23 n=1 Tax=Spermothamnion repens TaxID=31383 RepID=A0A4D6X492_9FLOR|nr:hypothetical protein [Spermothamnion repens]